MGWRSLLLSGEERKDLGWCGAYERYQGRCCVYVGWRVGLVEMENCGTTYIFKDPQCVFIFSLPFTSLTYQPNRFHGLNILTHRLCARLAMFGCIVC
jgi:hypothetical protein